MPDSAPRPEPEFERMLGALKAVAEENRLKLLGLLASHEYSVEELAELLDLKAPTVSHHLARLREAELVRMRSDGNAHLYRLDPTGLKVIRECLGNTSRVARLASDLPDELEHWEQKVLRSFVDGNELLRIPASRKKRRVILRWLVGFFEEGVAYPEREINQELKRHHWDCATLRREFVAHKLMERNAGMYWRLPDVDDEPPRRAGR